jgi:lipid IVA palmitoyltransferase
MFFKRTILACSVALLFPALPSYAEVGAENGSAAQAEKPGLWQRFTR